MSIAIIRMIMKGVPEPQPPLSQNSKETMYRVHLSHGGLPIYREDQAVFSRVRIQKAAAGGFTNGMPT